jgi:hypothetical protein
MQEFRKRTKGSGNLKNRFDDAVELKVVCVTLWDLPTLRFKGNLLALSKFM